MSQLFQKVIKKYPAAAKRIKVIPKLKIPIEIISIHIQKAGILVRFRTNYENGYRIEIGDSLLNGLFDPKNNVRGWVKAVEFVEVEWFIWA